MNLTADLFPAGWKWIAWTLCGAIVVHAAWRAPWRWLATDGRLHVFLGSVVALLILWSISTGIRPGLGFHLLGATACVLMFGPQLALGAMTLVMIGASAFGSLEWWSLPLNVLVMGVVPIQVSLWILRGVERRLPPHLFVYIFVVAFFGGAVAMIGTGMVASLALVAAGAYSIDYLLGEYLPWFILMAWAEAFTTGAAITLAVVYRPSWVATFDDARYLRHR